MCSTARTLNQILSSCGNFLGLISWKFQRKHCFITFLPSLGPPRRAPTGGPPLGHPESGESVSAAAGALRPTGGWGLGFGFKASRLGLVSAPFRLDFDLGFDLILIRFGFDLDFALI